MTQSATRSNRPHVAAPPPPRAARTVSAAVHRRTTQATAVKTRATRETIVHTRTAPTTVHTRIARSLTARFEQWFFPRLAARLPAWILPDHLTLLGLAAATGIAVAYGLSGRSPAWLVAAGLGLVVHWLADSLDGTLARVRRIQRPRYGFYLDHISDAYATFAIGIGLGLSPYMLLAVALAVVVGYLVLSINVYLETHVLGEFRYGYGVVGPTEARALLIVLNLVALAARGLPFDLLGIGMTVFDVAGVAAAAGMIALLSIRVRRNLLHLGGLEPPNVVKDEPA